MISRLSRFTFILRASRTSLRFTRLTGRRNSRGFGYASPAQAAKAVPALTKTTAVAVLFVPDGLLFSKIFLLYAQ